MKTWFSSFVLVAIACGPGTGTHSELAQAPAIQGQVEQHPPKNKDVDALPSANSKPVDGTTAQNEGSGHADVPIDPEIALYPAPLPAPPSTAVDSAVADERLSAFDGASVTLIESRYPDGSLRRRSYEKRTKSGASVDHGPDWRWYENHQIWIKRTWRDGKQSGSYEEWHEGGYPKARGNYVDDQKDGAWSIWHESGRPASLRTWKNGKPDGRAIEWYPSGRPKIVITWRYGKQEGPSITWTPAGVRSSEVNWSDGQRDGASREWFEDGRSKSTGSFVHGRENGAWTLCDKAGGKTEEVYRDGMLEGRQTVWGANGQKLTEGDYAQGKPTGQHVAWFESGAKKAEIEYKDGQRHGQVRYYFENGTLQIEGEMVDGKKEGQWVYFTADGTKDAAWSGRYHLDQRLPD